MKHDTDMSNWHLQTIEQVVVQLNSDVKNGLSDDEAQGRLLHHGPNELTERSGKHPLRILWQQFTSIMVLVLIAAAVVSGLLGKVTETIAITAIVVLFALLGFIQEYRAEQAMAALKKLAVPVVRVVRDGKRREISARELVPGDLILLEAGSAIPADVRLSESANLRVQEAVLTGESEAAEKDIGVLVGDSIALGDRLNMGYMGTAVTYGRGAAIVVGTGMDTELGKIAALIQDVDEPATPLQRRLDNVGIVLALVGLVVAGLVLAIGVVLDEDPRDMFLTAVSVAVAVVPEGLPAVVTVTLALGAQRMLRRNSLIRKLPAVETLGAVTIIASDKTGTLTENRMTVTVIDVAGHYLELGGTLRAHPTPALVNNGDVAIRMADQPPAIGLALVAGALCNDASLLPDTQTGRYTFIGDPTEGALLVAAQQAGIIPDEILSIIPRVAEIPFDSERKRMTTVHRLPDNPDELPESLVALREAGLRPGERYVAFTKGAVDGMTDISTHIWVGGEPLLLEDDWRERINRANEQMAQNGMRVLGIGVQWIDDPKDELEQNLTMIGLVGMIDPPRPEVKAAVATAKTAGIRPIMITGDHPLTARFIAHDLGISDNGRVKTGQMLDAMTPAELAAVVDEVSIFARVTPAHKLQIVETLQEKGHVVAMTGDGVNDSPALKKANIGIAMGITGTDVSKEASDMVLLDDNFATIVAAVEEGRVIYDNIRRFVKFSIAGNIGKVLVMLMSPLLLGAGAAVALLPLQLLWLNLLTDGLLGLGLGVEPPEKNTMRRPPRNPQASLFSEGLGIHVLWVGLLIGIVALLVGWLYFDPANPDDKTWQTMIFTTLAFLQVGQALASRSSRESLFSMGLRTNMTLLSLSAIVLLLQLAVLYAPFLEQFFQIVPLATRDLLIAFGLGTLAFVAVEAEKWLLRRRGVE